MPAGSAEMESKNLQELPPSIKYSLAKLLDQQQEPNWRSVVRVLPEGFYKKTEVEAFAMAILKPTGSPTLSLIHDLGRKGVTVQRFIQWLEVLETKGVNTKDALALFQQEEAPVVVKHPASYKLTTGATATIQVEVKGSPPMEYQWFKERNLLSGRTQEQLTLENVTSNDTGYYTCRIANNTGYTFSYWSKISVEQAQEIPTDHGASRHPTLPNTPASINEPSITVQPVSLTLLHGEKRSLYCDAVGNPAPSFQWYKDNERIDGANNRECVITSAGIADEGSYFCKVSNEHAVVVSDVVDITVLKEGGVGSSIHGRGLQPQFQDSVDHGDRETATDKIALLIGNKDYIHAERLGRLYHPTNDVRDVAGILQSIGFKVVSLIDLTLLEMRLALDQFCSLLGAGMYGLFYFAGHGFEINGVSYLMPVDATHQYSPDENVAAGDVLDIMQHRNAKLSVLFLDCCRTTPASVACDPLPSLSGALDVKQGNVLITFGCCSQGRVFESSDERNGFFAKHLIKYLGRDQHVEHTMFKIAKGIENDHIVDPSSLRVQRVYRHSSLTKDISLCDDIDPLSDARTTRIWQLAHKIPESVTVYEMDNFRVELHFVAEFSNSLIVTSKVFPGDITEYSVKFIMPTEVDGCVVCDISGHESFLVTMPIKYESMNAAVQISSLQRLEDNLELILMVIYRTESREVRETVRYDIGKPLYAKVLAHLQCPA